MKESSVESAPEPKPSPDLPTTAAEPPDEIPPASEPIGKVEQVTPASDVPEDETQGDDSEVFGGQSSETGVVAEEPIRLDESEPARSGRSDEEEEGSLRELFWGEE